MTEPKKASRTAILEAEGWERRTTACEPRLSELVELYESLGFEVRVEEVEAEEGEECRDCFRLEPGRYKIVFTRSPG